MPITPERFQQGMTYQAYKAQMTRNRERLDANERNLQIKPDDLEAFRRLRQPVRVLRAEDGQAALEAIERGGIDVALLDVQMPRLDGLAVAERAQRELGSRCPRIVVTSARERTAGAFTLTIQETVPEGRASAARP